MKANIKKQIQLFTQVLESQRLPFLVDNLCPYVYRLSPKNRRPEKIPGKELALTVMAVTHGNEVGGIRVLNRLLELLASGMWQPNFSFVLALGNPWASLEEKRYLERDLNRSFARDKQAQHEDRRARELETVLQTTAFFVDIHQTIEASDRPFFIFPYNAKCYRFARSLADDIPIVTHWGGGFSRDGACTDEYVNKYGGVGITVELGKKGFHPYQEGVGLKVCLEAFNSVNKEITGQELTVSELEPEILTWAEVIPYPDGEEARLDEGWYNFKWVEKDQRLGIGNNGKDIIAPCSGPVLFPKYLRDSSGSQRPKEICRIMKFVTEDQLGH